jgi:hypothetical protein
MFLAPPYNTFILYKSMPFCNMFWINVTGMTVTDDLNYTLYSTSLCAKILRQRRQPWEKGAGQQVVALLFVLWRKGKSTKCNTIGRLLEVWWCWALASAYWEQVLTKGRNCCMEFTIRQWKQENILYLYMCLCVWIYLIIEFFLKRIKIIICNYWFFMFVLYKNYPLIPYGVMLILQMNG